MRSDWLQPWVYSPFLRVRISGLNRFSESVSLLLLKTLLEFCVSLRRRMDGSRARSLACRRAWFVPSRCKCATHRQAVDMYTEIYDLLNGASILLHAAGVVVYGLGGGGLF